MAKNIIDKIYSDGLTKEEAGIIIHTFGDEPHKALIQLIRRKDYAERMYHHEIFDEHDCDVCKRHKEEYAGLLDAIGKLELLISAITKLKNLD